MTSYAIYLGPEVQKDTLGLDQICTSALVLEPSESKTWMVKSGESLGKNMVFPIFFWAL